MEILEQVSTVFKYILPILGVIVLIMLLVILARVNRIIKGLDTTVSSANQSLDMVRTYLGDMNTTVRTVNNVSMSVEGVRVALTNLLTKAIKKWNAEYETIKKMLTAILEKFTKEPEAEVTIVEPKKEEN